MKAKFGAVLIFLLGVFSVTVFFWPGVGNTWVDINVYAGTTARQIAENLKSQGLLNSRYPFLVWTRLRNAGTRLKVGRYRLAKGRSAFWIVDDLISGRTLKVYLTVPEGYASWQIAERLDVAGLCDGAAFLKHVQENKLEGFLFPARYELDFGQTPAQIVEKMRHEFDQRWTKEFDGRARELKLSQNQVVTLASILEREIRVREELPLISAVYHNRIKKKMPLGADPTVQYAMGFWKKRLTYDDYRKTLSPYNTYLHAGLPPGPICSPSEDAIRAALWPAQSDALYMLAQDDGRHSFSQSYREHINKVNARNRELRQRKMLERPS